ncbi:MAG: galactose oxidase-like domain-containing protein [Thermoleophilia bacterium]
MAKRQGSRRRRLGVAVAVGVSACGAAALGLAPVLAGTGQTRSSSGLEAGVYVDHGIGHLSVADARRDKLRVARCAVSGYRAAFPWKCSRATAPVRRAEFRQQALCAKVSYRKRHPAFCPTLSPAVLNQSLKRSFAQQPASVTGRWDPNLVQIDGLAINSILLPTGKILWFAYPEKPNFAYDGSNEAQVNDALNYAEAWVFDPATGTSVRRNPPIDPATGKPYNIWCAGQTLLRDGRVLVAGGNEKYYSTASPKYEGLKAVLTFNPFNETWTVQPSMRDGRWYPTLTELADGRVVITAGLNSAPSSASEWNNPDIEVFTPSPDMNGVGTIQKVAEQFFGMYPHVFLNGQGKLITVGPATADSHIINPSNWSIVNSTPLPDFEASGGRREWGSAVMLPGGADGPNTVLMVGGSNIAPSYENPHQTNTTLLVNMTTGGITSGPPNIRARSHVNTTILPDGSLFTNGGGAGSIDGDQYAGPVFTGELLPAGGSAWIETDAAQEERTYHSTSLLLPDGRVATMGDDRAENSRNRAYRRVEYYNPPYLYKGGRPTITSAPAGTPYGVPVGIGTPDAIAKAVIISLGATTHANDMNQRSLSLNVTPAAGGVSVTMPSSMNAAPPGYYQLFLLNAAGVPSVSRIIRLDTGLPTPPATPGAPDTVIQGPAPNVRPTPKLKRITATVKFARNRATVTARLKASAPFKSTVRLFPLPKGQSKRAKILASRAISSKTVTGAEGRDVAVMLRFSTKGRRFPLKLRMTIRLEDKRGGTVGTITKGLLVRKAPKPRVTVLARAR